MAAKEEDNLARKKPGCLAHPSSSTSQRQSRRPNSAPDTPGSRFSAFSGAAEHEPLELQSCSFALLPLPHAHVPPIPVRLPQGPPIAAGPHPPADQALASFRLRWQAWIPPRPGPVDDIVKAWRPPYASQGSLHRSADLPSPNARTQSAYGEIWFWRNASTRDQSA
uniref:Uncharacterized protein n=1 Tax=Mycena chlorophos TaxID=658473 RepID=A0ABQ0LDD6_MYCCL|nr:predicted protein [Mycena chlorophos]